MHSNLNKFRYQLPYASEIYGVYQPLIGWKSRLLRRRLAEQPGVHFNFPRELGAKMYPGAVALENVQLIPDYAAYDIFTEDAYRLEWDFPEHLDSLILRFTQEELSINFMDRDVDDHAFWIDFWKSHFEAPVLQELYQQSVDYIHEYLQKVLPEPHFGELEPSPMRDYMDRLTMSLPPNQDYKQFIEYVINHEIFIARYLERTARQEPLKLSKQILVPRRRNGLDEILNRLDPRFGTPINFENAVFSPVGILNLYRQYFFEFETFLGPPVEHVWLSPGSTLELIETSTRRTLIERTSEQFTEMISRSEGSSTEEDELSRAIKSENQRDVKIGSSLEGGVNVLVFNIQASGSLESKTTEREAREENHRVLRKQSSKLSSEIRQNYKSTFKIVTETTDQNSKRYVIENPESQLVNYELRRKMRQVGVQMQAIGKQLCWQVYVDDPGAQLGVAELIHLASNADLTQYPNLASVTVPGEIDDLVNIDLVVPNEGDKSNLTGEIASGVVGYVAAGATGAVVGVAVHEIAESLFGNDDPPSGVYGLNTVNKIMQQFKYALPDGYKLAPEIEQPNEDPAANFVKNGGDIPIRWLGKNGKGIIHRAKIVNETEGLIALIVEGGEVTSGEIIEFQANLRIEPTAAHLQIITEKNKAIAEQNKQNDLERERLIKQELIKNVKERVKFASQIRTRNIDDLREEERTVIYRQLIRLLMREAWDQQAHRDPQYLRQTHLQSELIKSIFDVDKMLYYVAPEWWQPRLHRSSLATGATEVENFSVTKHFNPISREILKRRFRFSEKISEQKRQKSGLGSLEDFDMVSWGGDGRKDNYYITEDSEPARLGSSLGWLLQLDGDNLRNAFLNAPWVKAVIPIIPGRELEALEWLTKSNVEGVDGLEAMYDENRTIHEALVDLAKEIKELHDQAKQLKEGVIEIDEEPETVHFLPTDEVFERGFDPLKGGFRATPDPDEPFEIYDQWIEVLPTDQIVAVKVDYDPRTGKLKT